MGFSKDELAKFIGNPRELTFVNIATTPFSCLDDRYTQSVLSTPGGDAGEFILALFMLLNLFLFLLLSYEEMMGLKY